LNPWIIVILAAAINSFAGIMLKQSRVGANGGPIWELIYSPWFFGACLCYFANVFLFAKSLDRLPVSLVYPAYAGLGFALIAVAGNILFGEKLGLNQWAGVILIFSGIVAASWRA
jgi:small multidrug resistance pump